MKIGTDCPICGGTTRVKAIECKACGSEIRGFFLHGPLHYLSAEDQQFIVEFVLCDGKLKDLAERFNVTYPTIRSRLDRVIEHLKKAVELAQGQKRDILGMIDRGEMDPEVGARLISQL